VKLEAFRALVRALAADVPEEYFDGVLEVEVSPRTLAHPTRAGIYTMGECVPVTGGGAEGPVQSRVVLYHGSFAALAREGPGFDWRTEARETLWHELRHHLEWRADTSALEAFDRAAEHNFARVDGETFDPLFYLDGDSPVADVYQVDDDWFYDLVVRRPVREVTFVWHGRRYAVQVPEGVVPPCYLMVAGVDEPPEGDLVLSLRPKPRLLDLFREWVLVQAEVPAEDLGEAREGDKAIDSGRRN
jgi:hypothetical protein